MREREKALIEIYSDVSYYMRNAYLSCHWFVDAVHKLVHMFEVFCHLGC